MTDWADEIEKQIEDALNNTNQCEHFVALPMGLIARELRAAERRGRAEGMREAADMMVGAKFYSINNCPYCGSRDLRKSFYRAGEDSGHEIVCIPEGRKIVCAEEILAASKLDQPE
jgi:hypothetical protein